MSRALGKLLLLCSPFLVVSGILFYLGFTARPGSLTDDGYDLRTFFYVMGAWFLFVTLAVGAFLYIRMRRRERNLIELAKTGEYGTAIVLSLRDTGVTINDNPRVTLQLEIHLPNRQPMRATKTTTVPLIHIPQVQKGSTVNVIADPNQLHDEKKIELLF